VISWPASCLACASACAAAARRRTHTDRSSRCRESRGRSRACQRRRRRSCARVWRLRLHRVERDRSAIRVARSREHQPCVVAGDKPERDEREASEAAPEGCGGCGHGRARDGLRWHPPRVDAHGAGPRRPCSGRRGRPVRTAAGKLQLPSPRRETAQGEGPSHGRVVPAPSASGRGRGRACGRALHPCRSPLRGRPELSAGATVTGAQQKGPCRQPWPLRPSPARGMVRPRTLEKKVKRSSRAASHAATS
jgi:hypothetical protein